MMINMTTFPLRLDHLITAAYKYAHDGSTPRLCDDPRLRMPEGMLAVLAAAEEAAHAEYSRPIIGAFERAMRR